MKDILTNAIVAVIIIGTILGFVQMISAGLISRGEQHECRKWAKQAEVYRPQFYLTEWQKNQCDYHGIEINAPVR